MIINVRIDDDRVPYVQPCFNKFKKGKADITWHLVSAPDHELLKIVGLATPPFSYVDRTPKDITYKNDNKGGGSGGPHPKVYGYDLHVREISSGQVSIAKAIIRNEPY